MVIPNWIFSYEAKCLSVFLLALLASYLATPIARRIAFGLNIVDRPNERKIHKKVTPLLGGLPIFGAFSLALLYNYDFSHPMKGVIVGGIIIFAVGLIDDRIGLPAVVRLTTQIGATLIMVSFGVILTFLPNVWWGKAGEILLTLIWVVGLTNALNFMDGMDGLAAGLAAVSSFFFFVIAFQTNQPWLGAITLALLGGCLGFLRYNFRPASIFLGDAGSTFLGFTLAGIAVMGGWAEDNVLALSVPILVLGVPIFDMVFITITRVANRKVKSLSEWIEYAAKDHFHHRLVDLGLSQKGAVLFIYSVSICLGISAVVLWGAIALDGILLLAQASIIFTVIAVLMLVGKRRRSGWVVEK